MTMFKKKIIPIHKGEAVMNRIQAAKMQIAQNVSVNAQELKDAIKQCLDEIQDSQVEISEAELEQRIREIFKAYNIPFPYDIPTAVSEALRRKTEQLNKAMNQKPHTCSQCGAPIHNGKCDYCGTEYK